MFEGSIPALVTPMGEDGSIDFGAWEKLLDFHLAAGTDGVVVGGTTGESPVLERGEIEELIRRAKSQIGGRIPVIAGSGTNSTAGSVALSRAAEAAGADALLVVTPYYNKPTQEGLFQHFNAVADAVDIPLILYNVPGRTACDMLADTVARLSQHPRIAGVKEATGDIARGAAILRQARPGFLLLSGDDPTAAELIRIGARGVISVTANVAARAMHELCAAGLAGRHGEAMAINERLIPLHKALFLESNPIPVKWAVHRLGLIGPGIRLPLTPLSAPLHGAVAAAMAAAGLETG
ncbi:MAG: 4-hydroxy-tetrahydrodipicolinate synthase [Pseudomonadota bacterium]|jgi:4-hydroxy-tetrahydrodipicolinate synthase|nr:4-hydroxy-tetrahydrodipicolinate synthase [Pseudomonadota bacterium]MDQ1341452.1 4-hydroxy-tetrahydrodipicolinate synthase [Pseudomonadota bacterium]